MANTLSELVDRAAFASTEAQIRLEDLVGDASWQVDLGEEPTITWETSPEPTAMRAELLGTVAAKSATWHWGWDNINDFPRAVVARAERVRARADGLSELDTAEQSIDDDELLPLRIAVAAKALTGNAGHFAAAAGAGTDVWLLVSHRDLDLGAPSAMALGRLVAQTLSTVPVADHRAALESYARERGYRLQPAADSLTLLAADGAATVHFESGRIVDIELSSAPAAEPAPVEPMPRADELSTLEASPEEEPAGQPPVEEPAEEPVSSLEVAPEAPEEEPVTQAPAAHADEAPAGQEEQPPAEPAREPEGKREKKGFFSRLFGGGR